MEQMIFFSFLIVLKSINGSIIETIINTTNAKKKKEEESVPHEGDLSYPLPSLCSPLPPSFRDFSGLGKL